MLFEGLKDIKQQYVDSGKVPEELFGEFVNKDDSRNNKYVLWMCKQYVDNPNYANHIADAASVFDSLVTSKKIKNLDSDIYRYTLEEVDKIIDDLAEQEQTNKLNTVKQLNIIYDSYQLLVIRIDSHEDAQIIGNTLKKPGSTDGPWCIGYKNRKYWDNYVGSGDQFYYVYDKYLNKGYMIQVFGSLDDKVDINNLQVWDSNDNKLDYGKFKRGLAIY